MLLQNTVTMKGLNGRVLWGYQEAADLASWEVVGDAAGARVHAVLRSSHSLRIGQTPLVFAVPRARNIWRWPITSPLSIHGESVTFTVGPCLE